MDPVESVLAHFGVKGMKWGVRKERSAAKGAMEKQLSETAVKKHEVLAKIKTHGLDAATNDDLKMLEQRVKLETKFNEMFPKKKHPAVILGEEIVKRVLIPVGEQQAKNFLNQKVGGAIIGPGTKPVQNTAGTKKTVDGVLKIVGDHKLADQPKTKLPHFGFA